MLQRSEFMPIIPRHLRLLEFLRQRLTVDFVGGVGWGGCRDQHEALNDEQLFSPLIIRGMVRDCTLELGVMGRHFVKVTAFGLACLSYGLMPTEIILGADDRALVGVITATLGGA